MTPQRLNRLAVLLLEFRDWLAHDDVQGTVEQEACSYLVDVIFEARKRLLAARP